MDQLRAALATRYSHYGTLPVSEIAWLLGYREVSLLTHAFKRWTGTTPNGFVLVSSQFWPKLFVSRMYADSRDH